MSHDYNLRIGPIVVALAFRHRDERQAFEGYFGRPTHPGPADIRLKIRIKDQVKELAQIPDSLFLTKQGDGKGFSVAGGLLQGRYSAKSGEGEIRVQSIMLAGCFSRIFEQILYQAFWSAVRRTGKDALLLHSSGIVRKGRGYVFTGKSGTGKSTVAGLNDGGIVLNDEITAIDFSGGLPVLMDTPFNGAYASKSPGMAPLAAILLLRHGDSHRVCRMDRVESIKLLSGEIIPPMGLETPLSPAVYWDMLGQAQRLHDRISAYLMEFLPDPGFWECIDRLEVSDDVRENQKNRATS